MQYLIMLVIVVGLAAADIVTGWIKAYSRGRLRSRTMRKGGLNKLAEIVVMSVAIGLNVGFEKLGEYYHNTELTALAGSVTALTVFFYITVMELISILENFAEINPQAKWIKRLTARLHSLEDDTK